MDKKDRLSHNDVGPAPHILALAALFEGEFSIDWIQELEEIKATHILLTMNEGIDQGLLVQRGPGVYSFVRPREREKLWDSLSSEEREGLHRKIADLMLNEIPDEPGMTKAVGAQLLHVHNDEEGCLWLLKAGDLYRKSFCPAEALQCYDKLFQDLRSMTGPNADSLFFEAAIGYSKVSASTHESRVIISVLKEAMRRAETRGSPAQLALLEMHLAKNEWLKARYNIAFKQREILADE